MILKSPIVGKNVSSVEENIWKSEAFALYLSRVTKILFCGENDLCEKFLKFLNTLGVSEFILSDPNYANDRETLTTAKKSVIYIGSACIVVILVLLPALAVQYRFDYRHSTLIYFYNYFYYNLN